MSEGVNSVSGTLNRSLFIYITCIESSIDSLGRRRRPGLLREKSGKMYSWTIELARGWELAKRIRFRVPTTVAVPTDRFRGPVQS